MDINTEVHNAFEVIKNGGIILYPTDTVWGIGCDATNEEAVKKYGEECRAGVIEIYSKKGTLSGTVKEVVVTGYQTPRSAQ